MTLRGGDLRLTLASGGHMVLRGEPVGGEILRLHSRAATISRLHLLHTRSYFTMRSKIHDG